MIQSYFMNNIFTIILFLSLISCSSSQKDFTLRWPTDIQTLSRKKTTTHDGIDIIVPTGTKVYAAHTGTVIGSQYSQTLGNFIILEFQHWGTLYAHLKKSLVKRGQSVQKGQVIGYSGASGKGTGPHLHFELLKNKKPINPLPYLKK